MSSDIFVEIIIRGLSIVLLVIFIITTLQYGIKNTKFHKSLVICVSLFWLSAIAGDSMEIVRRTHQVQNNLTYPDAMYKSYGLISRALFNISIACFYVFELSQLYFSFRGSYYPLSKLSIILHIINLIIVLLLCGVFVITFVFFTFTTVPLNFMAFLLVCGIIHFVYSFNKRLFQLIIATSKIDTECSSNSRIQSMSQSTTKSPKIDITTPNKTDEKQKVSFNESQRTLLKTVAKHTVLLSLVVCMMILLVLVGVFFTKCGIVKDGELTPVSFQIIYIFAKNCIALCLWLGIARNEQSYQCMLHGVDNCCLKLCKRIVSYRIVKDEQELIKTMQQTSVENEMHNHQSISVSPHTPPAIQ